MTAYDVIVLACVVLAGACITLVLLLLATRIAVNLKTQRDERVMAPIRLAMLTMATCEDDDPDVETARGTLGSLPRKRQADFHELGYAMLARLHGETRDRLCALLVEDGAHRRATRMATSRRIDQRCLGLHHLGLLGRPATRHLLSGAVEHNDRDIRRVALQSATGYGTGAPVLAMLEAAVQEPTLRRDFLGAIAVLGRDATDEVLSALDALSQAQQRGWMSEGALSDAATEPGRRTRLLLEAAGLTGGQRGGRSIVALLPHLRDPTLIVAALVSLGRIDDPSCAATVRRALDSETPAVRRSAADTLGKLGDPASAPLLGALTDDEDLPVARAAAHALAACGDRGRRLLLQLDTAAAAEVRGRPDVAAALEGVSRDPSDTALVAVGEP